MVFQFQLTRSGFEAYLRESELMASLGIKEVSLMYDLKSYRKKIKKNHFHSPNKMFEFLREKYDKYASTFTF